MNMRILTTIIAMLMACVSLTDIDDVNAIVNLILAGGGSGNARADLDHNGAVDVDDLNALINILLEK